LKIAILSQDTSLYSTKRLKEACLKRGHQVRILDAAVFSIIVEQGQPSLYYKDKPLERFDALIPRIGSSITFYGTAVVRQFEQMGVFSLNSSLGILTSRDKLRSIQMLAKHNIGIPKSAFAKQRSSIKPAIDAIGGSPVVIKLLEGTQGIGVILADTDKVAEAIIETFQSTRQNVLIQKFIAESRGRDIRAVVVGNRVVAAMRRTAFGDEFRSNIHRGGVAKAVNLDAKFEQAAVRATQIMGLHVAGVDLLESKEGPKVLEVNSSPGLEGIEETTGVDVAGAMIAFLEEQSNFPEIDLRQRLTLDKGFGVAEIHLLKNSNLNGSTIKASGFREKDIVVLSIKRGRLTISNPKSSRELQEGDTLLCFGKLDNMRSVILESRRSASTSGRKSHSHSPQMLPLAYSNAR